MGTGDARAGTRRRASAPWVTSAMSVGGNRRVGGYCEIEGGSEEGWIEKQHCNTSACGEDINGCLKFVIFYHIFKD